MSEKIQKTAELEKICKFYSGELGKILNWKWDDWFKAVLGEFSVEKKQMVKEVLNNNPTMIWDSSKIDTAPEKVKKIVTHLGGLRDEQMLYFPDPMSEAFLFGAWWPWGNGETISLRLGIYYPVLSTEEIQDLHREFKSWFGL